MAQAKQPPPTEKAFPATKTIILRENDPESVTETTRPGVWSRNLAEDITLNEGDTVLLKSSFVDTKPNPNEGLITIEQSDIDQLSITTGLYWQDSGNGVPIDKYNATDIGMTAGADSPYPQMSQVIQSEGAATCPNGKNYILQNQFSDFTNTLLFLNTPSVKQTGAARAITSPFAVSVHTPGTNYIEDSTSLDVPTSLVAPETNGNGLHVDYETGTGSTPGAINKFIINTDTNRGFNYAVDQVVDLAQDPVRPQPPIPPGVANQPAQVKVDSVAVFMNLEMVPNSAYDPTPGNTAHQYFDYTIQQFIGNPPVGVRPAHVSVPEFNDFGDPIEPPIGGGAGTLIPLIEIGNLIGLNVRSNPLVGNQFFIYPYTYSQGFAPLGTPSSRAHMAVMTSNTNAEGVPEWTILPNLDWDKDADLINSPLSDGWVFDPIVSYANGGGVSFNSGGQSGVYRILLGLWAWLWVPGLGDQKRATDPTYPAAGVDPSGKQEYNYYNLELEYYAPGNGQGGGQGSNKSVLTKFPFEWRPAITSDPRLFDWYEAQFPNFVDRNRAGLKPANTGSLPDPPSNLFPIPPKPNSKEIKRGIGANYPETKSNEYFAPVFLKNMIDTSSAKPGNVVVFPDIIYDQNPGLHMTKESDTQNFKPFRLVAGGSLWVDGKAEMASFPQCGFIQQDHRGCIQTNPDSKTSANNPYVPSPVPPIWAPGSTQLNQTTMQRDVTPSFSMTHECVISKPFIPGSGSMMTPRTFTTKIADLPDVNLVKGQYTYAAWARILTDALNRTPRINQGLSNQPSAPEYPLNAPTYSSSRILTDTVQLGYQGRNFPSNRRGLGWDVTARPQAPQDITSVVSTANPFTGYVGSQQPYWVSEDGKGLFAYKDGTPATPPTDGTTLPAVDYATVDPLTATSTQQTSVYGENGAKWCGAEALSIIFNEESQAFEIVQMHSNMYSADSGATVVRSFRSGTKSGADGTIGAYPDGIQELSVADQTGGVFITDWQPKSLWEKKMNFPITTKVHTGGAQFPPVKMDNNGFYNQPITHPQLASVTTNVTTLIRGQHITGNFRAGTDFINKRVNIPTNLLPNDPNYPKTRIGGAYQSPVIPFNLETEVSTPVTILADTIIPNELLDPFFMIEIRGLNQNAIYGLDTPNNLISSIVGRYFATSNFTMGSSDGSITYVHRGEPMVIKELSIRILDSTGAELDDTVLMGRSAVILEIAGQDISLIQEAPK